MAFTDEIRSKVLSKFARVCCICREFKPLHVQVHHIREKSEGETDEWIFNVFKKQEEKLNKTFLDKSRFIRIFTSYIKMKLYTVIYVLWSKCGHKPGNFNLVSCLVFISYLTLWHSHLFLRFI